MPFNQISSVFTFLGLLSVVSGFINDPLDSTPLPILTTPTERPSTTKGHAAPSHPGEVPPEVQDQLQKMQEQLAQLSKENSALKLQVTSLENDVTTLIQLQERVRQLEEDNVTTKREITAIQSSGSISTRVDALEATQPQVKADISSLKLQLGGASRAFNTALQGIQTSLSNVNQTINRLIVDGAGTFPTANPGSHVTPQGTGTVTLVPPQHTTPLNLVLHDCLDVYERDQTPGVFTIQPRQSPKPFKVFCDNGWTIIQRRIDGSIPFSSPIRRWSDYVGGFGNVSGEFWLGNDHVYNILAQETHALRVEAVGYSGKTYWAQYREFHIEDEKNFYRLNVSDYTGDFGDTMVTANGNAFVTPDHRGNVSFYRDCAGVTAGGWWANPETQVPNCGYNLNAVYSPRGNTCMSFYGVCMKTSIMKIIPSNVVT